MLKVGLEGKACIDVTSENTANTMKSGSLEVFATPAMIALMESAAVNCVTPDIEPGCTTVGTVINIKHLSSTPVGMTVCATSRLTCIDGKRLVFDVTAHDDKGIIGEGTHERFIVDEQRFMTKTNSKK